MTATLEAPPAPPPVPDATCAQVQAIMDGAARRVACKSAVKDLNGSFRITGGSLKIGFVRLAYVKDGFSRPAYHLTASRDADGLWSVTHCDCLGFASAEHCKHGSKIALALPTWPDESCTLKRLLLGDDGRRGRCGCGGTLMSVNWEKPGAGDVLTWVCDTCRRRVVL